MEKMSGDKVPLARFDKYSSEFDTRCQADRRESSLSESLLRRTFVNIRMLVQVNWNFVIRRRCKSKVKMEIFADCSTSTASWWPSLASAGVCLKLNLVDVLSRLLR